MYSLVGYISERLNPRHLGTAKFPIDGTIDEVVKFLERQGFEKIENKSYLLIHKSNKFNDTNSKSYMLDIDSTRIMFADTSKNNISEENPIFYYDEPHKEYGIHVREHTGMITNENIFKDELNKRFGWK